MTSAGVRLYGSPRGLYQFQAEGVAKCYYKPVALAVWDTGIGKSHLAMATTALLFEDDQIDLCLVIAERNKLERDEWPKDFATYTSMDWKLYHGVSPKKREQIRAALPQVLLSTYETIRADCAKTITTQKGKKAVKSLVPSVLTEAIAAQAKRVLIVYDEITKLGNRSSTTHKHHAKMIETLRKLGVEVRIIGLTATPVERSPENHYNLGRILIPHSMPTVADFETRYVKSVDQFGNPVKFKNLNADTQVEPAVTPFADLMRPIILRKRKTDEDVIDQFPQTVEEPPRYSLLSDNHYDFLDAVRETFETGDDYADRPLFTLMRQLTGHPASIIHSKGKMATQIVATVGEQALRSIGCAKLDDFVAYVEPLVKGQGAQVVVFTFFGQSVLPFVQEALEGKGITVAINHGGLGSTARTEAKERFRAGGADVFLTSDAGARGINLPEATYCVEYESAVTHANRVQRLNRIHRIDSKHPSVTFQTFVARYTVEEGIMDGVLRRNEWADLLLEDDDPGENWISAKDRKRVLAIARRRAA